MSRERLQRILARAGVGSRRHAEEVIRQGRVTVNGEVATLGQSADPQADSVKVDGRRVRPPARRHLYLLINKPPGVVSTVQDPEGRPTVLDLLPANRRRGLYPVGRLDFESEGLLLLTDDGDFAQHLAHPRYGCRKTYLVKVRGTPAEEKLERLRSGIVLDGKRTGPAEINARAGKTGSRDAINSSWWTVILSEGRNRQIRDMFRRIGHPVGRLRRVAIGSLRDPNLGRGHWRELSSDEVESLRRQTARRKRRPKAGTGATRRTDAERPGKPTSKAGAGSKPRGRAAQPGASRRRGSAPADRNARGNQAEGGANTRNQVSQGALRRGSGKRGSQGDAADHRESQSRDTRGAAAQRARGNGRPSSGRPSSAGRSPGGRSSSGRSSGGQSTGGRDTGERGPASRGPESRRSASRASSSRSPGRKGPGAKGPGSRGPSSRGSGGRGPGSKGPGGKGPGSRGPGSKGAGQGPGRKGKR